MKLSVEPTIFQKLQIWMMACATWIALGHFIGWSLDTCLWYASFNYLYSPHEFFDRFGRWSVAAGSIFAASACTGRRPPVRAESILYSAAICGGSSLIVSLAFGAVSIYLFGSDTPSDSNGHLAPIRRVWFCDGVSRGAGWGFAAGTMAITVRAWIQRFQVCRTDGVATPLES